MSNYGIRVKYEEWLYIDAESEDEAIEIAANGPAAGRPPAWTRLRSAAADLAAGRPFAPNLFGGSRE